MSEHRFDKWEMTRIGLWAIILIAGIFMGTSMILGYVWFGLKGAGLPLISALALIAAWRSSLSLDEMNMRERFYSGATKIKTYTCKECGAKFELTVYYDDGKASTFTRCPICGGELITEETDDEQMVS